MRALARTLLQAKNEHPRSKVKDTVMHSKKEGISAEKYIYFSWKVREWLAHMQPCG
jgi:hypothetical protein